MKAQIKGFSMVCMAALLLLAASCKKETKEETEYEGGFTAKAEAQQNDSKVYLVGSGLEWNNDESIMVFNSGGDEPTSYKFTSYKVCIDEASFKPNPETGSQSFYRSGGYKAYYPYDKMTNNGGTVSFTMPATQTYTVCDGHVTFDRNAFPMAGKTETPAADDRFIHFKNVCGLLKLQLYSAKACRVQSISITSNTGQKLCGTGTVGFDTDNHPTLSALTGGSTLTLNCNGENMSVNPASPSTYFFVVPAGTLGESFTVKVTETNGNIWTKTANAPANLIARSKITVLPKLAVETIPEGALPGLFSVSAAKKVYFSKGNLQYIGSTGTWKFADHQFDILGDNGQGSASTTVDRDLFCWGTSGYDNKFPYITNETATYYGNGETNISGTKYDWGVYNPISNGGNQAGKWRTLTGDTGGEWYYLINFRTMTYGKPRYTNKTGDGVKIGGTEYYGLFIYPDDYNGTVVGADNTTDTWEEINNLGIVFLPAAGYRNSTFIEKVGSESYYWSSSYFYNINAYTIFFENDLVDAGRDGSRTFGFSVRLVSDN